MNRKNLRQAEIARKLGYSRSAISRLIAEAHKKGIVEVTVKQPIQRSYYHEQKLMQVFNLKEAYVLMGAKEICDTRIRLLGQLGAQVLMENLPEDGLLGITWGYAVYEVVQAIKPRHLPKVKVVQMMGALGKGDPKIGWARLGAPTGNYFERTALHSPCPFDG